MPRQRRAATWNALTILLASAQLGKTQAFAVNNGLGRAPIRTGGKSLRTPICVLQATRLPPPKLMLPLQPARRKLESQHTSGIEKLPIVDRAMENLEAREASPTPTNGWDYWSYRLLLVFVAALWGTNFGTVKFIDNAHIVPSVGAALRFSIAAMAMAPFLRGIKKDVLLAGMECGIWITLGYFMQAIGLSVGSADKAAFICSLTVVVVPLINALSGKPIKAANVAAALLALAGCGFLELGDAANPGIGDLWSLGQPLGFGIAFTRIEHYAEKFPGKSLALTAGQLVTVAAASLAWCTWDTARHGMGLIPDLSFLSDMPVAAALGYTGLVTTALAVLLETIALEHVPAAEMSVIFSTEPLWATAFAGVLLGETLGPQAVVGASLILGACLIAQAPQLMGSLQGAKGLSAFSKKEELPAGGVPEEADLLFHFELEQHGQEDEAAATSWWDVRSRFRKRALAGRARHGALDSENE